MSGEPLHKTSVAIGATVLAPNVRIDHVAKDL